MVGVGCASSLERARSARDAERYQEAINHYKAAMDGRDAHAAELASREYSDMLAAVARSVARDDPTEAESIYRMALDHDPAHDASLTGIVRLYNAAKRFDEALKLVKDTGRQVQCAGCKRLTAVTLIARAQDHVQNKRWDQARDDYQRAHKLRPDPSTALATAEVYVAEGDSNAAVDALESASPLVRAGDTTSLAKFVELRQRLGLAAVANGESEVIERLLLLVPEGLEVGRHREFAVNIAGEYYKRGNLNEAISRLERAISGASGLGEERIASLRDRLGLYYSQRATNRLRSGDLDPANADLAKAQEYRPGDNRLKLQRILVLAGAGQLDPAVAAVQKLSGSTPGRNQVLAILESMRVWRLIERGNWEAADEALQRAQAVGPDVPEVHVAAAKLLSKTPVEGLNRWERRVLGDVGAVRYPGMMINRYGEALSELDWAQRQARGLGPKHPFRAPGADAKMLDLVQEIRGFLPV